MAAVNGLGGAAAFKNGFRLKSSGLYVGRFKKKRIGKKGICSIDRTFDPTIDSAFT